MKYSEYLQFRELLESNGITLEEFKKDPTLYEGILGNLGKKVLGLLGKGIKTLVSKGISKNHIQKLNQSANAIVKMVADKLEGKKGEDGKDVGGVISAIEKNIETYKNEWKKKNKIEEVPEDLTDKLENKKNKEIAKYINGQVEAYSDKVKNTIKSKDGVSDKDKEELMNYWQQLLTKVNVDVSGLLIKRGILEDDDASSIFKDLMKIRKKGAKDDTAGETKPAATPTKPAVKKPTAPLKPTTAPTKK